MNSLPLLWETPSLLYALVLIVGLIMGSFLNVAILRLPRMMELAWIRDCAELSGTRDSATAAEAPFNLARPGSHCPACQHALRAWENIPILSYLLLRGHCSACGARIAPRYPLIEALTALLSLVVIWHFGPTWQGGAALVLTWGLIALAVIDFDTQLLPDAITLPLLWLGLLLSLFEVFVDSDTAIAGALFGYLSLWSVFQLFRLVTGKEGMGRGDFKLLALFGAWLGWQAVPQIILLSALPGAVVGVALVAFKRLGRETPLPFGPYLAIAGWISLLWGDAIAATYLRWSGLS